MELKKQRWTQDDYSGFLEYVKSLGEESYKEFNVKIIPDTTHIFGVRVPVLRGISKEISKGNIDEFVKCEKGDYHEEAIIEGLVLASKKCGFEEMFSDIRYFCGKIYNWAICDTVSFKNIKNHRKAFMDNVDVLLGSSNPWEVRKGLGCMMEFFLDDEYINMVLSKTDSVKSDFYYVQMMQAWLLATAFAKCRDAVWEYLQNSSLSIEVLDMTVRKIRDSYRITKEDKDMVRDFVKKLRENI